jgi:hypothetical protein
MTVTRTTLSGTTALAADFIEKRLESAKRWFIFTHIELRSQGGIQASKQQTFSVLERQGSVASIESRDRYPILAYFNLRL